MPEETKKPRHASAFVRWLEDQGCLPQLDDEFAQLLKGVRDLGRSGQLSLLVGMKPKGNGRIELQERVSSKHPQPDAVPRTYYVDEDGKSVCTEDPRQKRLPFTVVPPKAEQQAQAAG